MVSERFSSEGSVVRSVDVPSEVKRYDVHKSISAKFWRVL